MKQQPYILSFFIFQFLLSAVPLSIQLLFPVKHLLLPGFWYIYLFFLFINVIFHIIASWGLGAGDKTSVRTFVGGTSVKFLVWMIFVFFYLRSFKVNNVVFMLNFFYLYLSNTVFEIYSLIRNLRNSNLK